MTDRDEHGAAGEATDTYHVLAGEGHAELTEKRSRFLAFARPVASEDEAREVVAALRRTYHDARHVCYAYVVGEWGETVRSSDDGEPSGTAGTPILVALRRADVVGAAVVVVRYFGGVKLGTGPLAVAYREAATSAIEASGVEVRTHLVEMCVEAPYDKVGLVMQTLRAAGAQVRRHDYTASGQRLVVAVAGSAARALRERLGGMWPVRVVADTDD